MSLAEEEIKIKKIDKNLFQHKRACVFASYNKEGKISKNIIKYLKELKKYTDYIIFVADNPILKNEIIKIDNIVDSYIFKRHGEYDFGSYKRGYFTLKEFGILNNIDTLLFCNDSVEFVGKSLEKVFNASIGEAFFGITGNTGGHKLNDDKYYPDLNELHIQSYFYILSKEIFNSDWLENFYSSVQKEENKINIIVKYEMGLSQLIKKHGYMISTFYKTGKNIDPYIYFLKPKAIRNQIFLKRILKKKKITLENIFQNLFSITNNEIKTHKVLTILGIKISIKKTKND